jgi:hypothetical protein
VECSFCHVEGHFEKDDKKPKQTARDMMRMMFALNEHNFEGQREVTCYSCHRGARSPVATPIVGDEPLLRAGVNNPQTKKLPSNLPTANQLIDSYIRALGGASAIEKITSRVERGIANISGQSVMVDVFTQSPNRRAVVQHLREGNSSLVFDEHRGWVGIPGRPTRDLQDADIEAAGVDADLEFPLHLQQMFPELRVEYPENIQEREANVLYGIKEGQPAAKFYFDAQSGLLIRLLRYAQSPLGLDPTQIDYSDYREVDGVQVPFHLTFSQPGSDWTLEIQEIRQNVPIDDDRFAKP